MTAALEFLVVSRNPTRVERIRGGAVVEDLQLRLSGTMSYPGDSELCD